MKRVCLGGGLAVFLLIFCAQINLTKNHNPKKRSIAVLVVPDYLGEYSLAFRIQAASRHLHWKCSIHDIRKFEKQKKKNYDFIINLVPWYCKFKRIPHYLAVFDPLHHYFEKNGLLKKIYDHYDGYLLTYSPKDDDKNFSQKQLPYLRWFPTVHAKEYQPLDLKALFHVCSYWGNRFFDPNLRTFFQRLDRESFIHIYGHPNGRELFPISYRGTIPFDHKSLLQAMSDAGIALVIHSDEHNRSGIPSGRIFEAAAASVVIICDENSFIKEHFKDSVLYIDTAKSPEMMLEQVQNHMKWILSNKEAALEKAKKAHAIYKNHFLLEDQLLELGAFHDELFAPFRVRFEKKIDSLRSALFGKIKKLFWKKKDNPLFGTLPSSQIKRIEERYSLINSVAFQPNEHLFCATYTQGNKVQLFQIDPENQVELVQTLQNPSAKLGFPQHAAFTPDGQFLVVINWKDSSLNFYKKEESGLFSKEPISTFLVPDSLAACRPHGISFSPCGNLLAIAFGASERYPNALALFEREGSDLRFKDALQDDQLIGVPKGVCFTPDSSHLFVTFADQNSFALVQIEEGKLKSKPVQVISGKKTGISRPEDIAMHPSQNYCAITNSDADTVTFYPFDKKSNRVQKYTPSFTLSNPKSNLCFPHSLAFSSDGKYTAVT